MALRPFAVVIAAAVLLAACVHGPKRSSVVVPPPLPAGGTVDLHWGTPVADPYRHLENVRDPQVQQWMKAQADATQSTLAALPGRSKMLQDIQALEASVGGSVSAPVRTASGRWFFLRRNPGENQFRLWMREGDSGQERLLYDPLAPAPGPAPRAVMDFAPSPDGRMLAYSVQYGGSEIGDLHVIDVASGQLVAKSLDRIRYASPSWLADGSGLFFNRLPEGFEQRPPELKFEDRGVHFLDLAQQQEDRRVLSPKRDPQLAWPGMVWPWLVQAGRSQVALAMGFFGTDRRLTLFTAPLEQAKAGVAQWRSVITQADDVQEVRASDQYLYVRTSKGAPRYQILRLDLADPRMDRAVVVVPQGPGVIDGMRVASDALYVTQRNGVVSTLARVAHGSTQVVPVGLPTGGMLSLGHADPLQAGVLVSVQSWVRALHRYRVHPEQGASALALADAGANDAPQDVESHEVMVTSHDGTQVPMSIIHRKGLKLDGTAPTIVYGYSAYGSTQTPFFSPRVLAWIRAGGVWATVHARGGGVYGDAWYRAGHKLTKPNTWKDTNAAAQWLVQGAYTRPTRLGVYGGSAGGILVGRAITERPDLYAAAVPSVGVMDTVRMETSANGVANIPEFGTVKDAAEFKGLLAMSSYHQVRDGVAYPAVMATHGVNDIRVDVWQSGKFVSRMATASTSGRPVLLRLNYQSGHGQGSSRADAQNEFADLLSFFLWQFGEPGYQP